MLGTRKDIIGDLFRLRQEIAGAPADPDTPSRYHDLEVLAAIAVSAGMSHNIIIKASNVDRDRIDTLIHHHAGQLAHLAEQQGYERDHSGVVARPQ